MAETPRDPVSSTRLYLGNLPPNGMFLVHFPAAVFLLACSSKNATYLVGCALKRLRHVLRVFLPLHPHCLQLFPVLETLLTDIDPCEKSPKQISRITLALMAQAKSQK